MSGIFSDLLGTLKSGFKVGGAVGVLLKNSLGNLVVRNTTDTADAALTASKVSVSGNLIELNSAAAGSGTDFRLALQRPIAGMTAHKVITMPSGFGTNGYAVCTDGADNWYYASTGSTASCDKIDTTAITFGSSSPIALFGLGAGEVISCIEVIIDSPFNGAPSLSVGVAGSTSKYLSATDVDLTAAAGTTFQVHPALGAQGAEALIGTYAAVGTTVGAARVLVYFATPS